MSALPIFAMLFFIVFIAGTLIGIFLIVCWASNNEDKKKTIKGPPPGNGTGGARHLTGVGRRGGPHTWHFEHLDSQSGHRRGRDG
ncbi:MAG TPA: hypothetical protein VMU95_36235 [Trebonia sp.]|nr:hypothetical protein [Trebonia sp.]